MSFVLGIISALIAPFLIVLGFIVWDNHWNGTAFSLNMFKCNLTAVGFAIVSLVVRTLLLGPASPGTFTQMKVGGLMVSSTIGILIGDWVWLEAMRLLGARKIVVLDSLKPFLAAFLGEVFLGERLKEGAVVGLILTVLGVAMVGLEKEEDKTTESGDLVSETTSLVEEQFSLKTTKGSKSYVEQRKNRKQSTGEIVYGLTMAVLNVVLHTFGALLTKTFGVGMTAFEISFIRFGFAGICMAILSFFLWFLEKGKGPMTTGTSASGYEPERSWYLLPKASLSTWMRISLGVVFVSFLQPALTNYAMFQISLALLLTLESIGPLYSLPLSYLLQDERPTFQAYVGATLAVAGIVILSFKGVVES